MDRDFITIGEASRLLKQTDGVIMRLLKDALLSGVEKTEIMKAEMREGRMMYLVNKSFLTEEMERQANKETKEETSPLSNAEEKLSEANPELLAAKQEMIDTLQKVVDTKDRHIEDLSRKIDQLIERDHETNVLLKGLQDRVFLLEEGKPAEKQSKSSQAKKQ